MEAPLKQGDTNTTFPIIVNTVLYTGTRPWKYSTAFDDYYALPNLGSQYLHLAPFNLIKLPDNQKAAIYRDPALGFCFAGFYSTRTKDPCPALEKFTQIPAISKLPSCPSTRRKNVIGNVYRMVC